MAGNWRRVLVLGLVWQWSAPMVALGQEKAVVPSVLPLKGVLYFISITGVIGKDFTAREFRSRLSIADRLSPKADLIALSIDSPGGSVLDMEKIIGTILAHRDKRFIAFLDGKALSAAALVALACDTIYMTEGTRIGAATPFIQKEDGEVIQLPPAVEEKQFSAMRALGRIAARHGGHSAALAEAMVDPDIEITMVRRGEVPVFQRGGNGSVVSRKGEVLTLTAKEAIDCGLARPAREFWAEHWKALTARTLVSASKVASDPLDDFASGLQVKWLNARKIEKLPKEEADEATRAWARREYSKAAWRAKPLPIVVTSIWMHGQTTPESPCTVVGESLFQGADAVFANIEGKPPPFVRFLQKGDIITVTGELSFDAFDGIFVSRRGMHVALSFRSCQIAQDR